MAFDCSAEAVGVSYIETEKVEAGKKAGQSIADLQKTITVASLKSMQSNGYSKYVSENQYKYTPNVGPAPPLQDGVNTNMVEAFRNLAIAKLAKLS